MKTMNPKTPYTLSSLIVDYLNLLGVEYLFGIPGGHISALYDALAVSERQGGVRAILSRHESGAAFMAAGYARETGRLGVCCATTGPGATNLVTGVAAAYADHDPILVLTAQTALAKFGQAAFQEASPDMVDSAAILGHCSYYNSLVSHPQQLEYKLLSALRFALRPPFGPVHLSIPVDIFRTAVQPHSLHTDLIDSLKNPPALLDDHAFTALCEKLGNTLSSKKPKVVILIGNSCGNAADDIIRFAERLNADIITTQAGKNWISGYHPLNKGVFGFSGHHSARLALSDEQVGLILAVGTRLGQWQTSAWDDVLLNNKLVHIHNSETYLARSPMAALHVLGSIETLFARLLSWCDEVNIKQNHVYEQDSRPLFPPHISLREPESYQTSGSPIHPNAMLAHLKQQLPDDQCCYVIDTGNALAWTFHYLFLSESNRYRVSVDSAAMTWGIGAAVGIALALQTKQPQNPDTVVCLTGDGCFLMSGQELTVAVEEQLNIIFVLLNDQSYSMVRQRHDVTGKEHLPLAIPPVNFCDMATAMGARAYRIEHSDDFNQLDFDAMRAALAGPTLLDVIIDPEQVAPSEMY